MGDVVREEARKRGYGLDREGQLRVMKLLRDEMGSAAIAMLCKHKIESISSSVVVIDGVRSPEEVSYFKSLGDVRVLAIHASPKTRFRYLRSRGRKDDPSDWGEFEKRDLAELRLRIGDVIALADGMIVNEGIDQGLLIDTALKLVRSWVLVREAKE